MVTTLFNWQPSIESNKEPISKYIDMYECIDTVYIAYHIKNKPDILRNLTFSGVYTPLQNNYGIYFLMGDAEDNNGKPTIYIGQASEREETKGMARLREHADPNTKDKYKDKWSSVLFITSKDNDWHPGILNDLERLFIGAYDANTNYTILNSNPGRKGNTAKEDLSNKVVAINSLLSLNKFGYPLQNEELIKNYSQKNQEYYEALFLKETISLKEEIRAELKEELSNSIITDAERYRLLKNYKDYKLQFRNIESYKLNGRLFDIDKPSKDQDVLTPDKIAKQMVELLPAEVFSSKSTFLDIYSKSGVYLVEILKRFLSDDPALPINQEEQYKDKITRLNHIVQNQLFAICGTIQGWGLSNKSVIDFIESQYAEAYGDESRDYDKSNVILPNIIYIDNYKYYFKSNSEETIKRALRKFKFSEEVLMRFDVVIGNPPYNNDIYLDFVQIGYKLSKQYTVMITPAKWQAKGGDKNEAFRKEIVPYMRKIVFYPCAQELFDIRNLDGISYYILEKTVHNEKAIKNTSSRQILFNNEQIRKIKGQLNNASISILSKLGTSIKFRNLSASYFGLKEGDIGGLSGKYAVVRASEVLGYTSNVIKNGDKISKYKVVMQRVLGNSYYGMDGKTLALNKMYIEKPNTVTIANYIGLYCSDVEDKCKSFVSYFDTRLIRFVMLVALVGQGGTDEEFWRYVPDPGAFDHIFTDAELYAKYNLTEEEINIIESVIKPR